MGKKKKLTKAEKKQQRENEKKLVAAGKISPRVRYMRRSFLWNVIAICIAFFFGIFAGLGALLGGGLFIGNKMSIKDILGTEIVEKYIGKDYYDKSVLDIISAFTDKLGSGIHSLNDVGEFTPLVKDTLDAVNKQLNDLGVNIDVDELMGVNFDTIGKYMQENVVQSIELGKVLGLDGNSDKIMLAICYGEEGKDYTIEDGKIVCEDPTTIKKLTSDATSILGRITLETAFQVTANSESALLYLAYGTEGEQYKIEDGKIVMLPDPASENGETFKKRTISDLTAEDATFLEDAKICDLVDTSNASGLMAAIKDWSISDMTQGKRIERLKLSQILTIGDDSSNIMQAMKNWSISDFTNQDKINSLALSDILDLKDAPKILDSLKDAHLGEFGDKINTLRLCDILDNMEGNELLKCLQLSTLSTLADDIKSISVTSLFGNGIYSYTVGKAGTYAEQLKYYKETGHTKEEDSKHGPWDNHVPEKAQITEQFWTNDGGMNTQVYFGSFVERNGNYVLLENPSLYKEKVGEETKLFVITKTAVTPVYAWYLINYGSGESDIRLTDGAISTTKPSGENDVNMGLPGRTDTPYKNEKGQNLIYHETREDGKTYYYPLYQDGYSVYYLYYETNATGSTVIKRQDLEQVIDGYTYQNGDSVEGYTVYEGKGEGAPSYYINLREDATQRYYREIDKSNKEYHFFEEDEIIVQYYANIKKTEKEWVVADESENASVEVDRYLSGFWYLLFGGEDEDGNPIDKTNEPFLEIDDLLTTSVGRIEKLTLWELFFHGFINDIDSNPYLDLSNLKGFDLEHQNLNEYNLKGVINLVKQMVGKLGAFSGT